MLQKIAIIAGLALLLSSFFWLNQKDTTNAVAKPEAIKWYTFEEAIKANETVKKKIFIDVYTDWCGWCKVMDRETFTNADVAKYMNENFYPVKLNAEKPLEINFQGHDFKWMDTGNGRGVNELAYSLLDGKLGYPTVVFLSENYERIMIAPGYKKADEMLQQLTFVGSNAYKKSSWEDFQVKRGY